MGIQIHKSLPRHPKLMRLASRLGIPRAQAAGHLAFLWLWTLDYAASGDLSKFRPEEIAAGAEFTGDAAAFVQALLETGFLDEDLRIHEWPKYGGKVEARRARNRERQRRKRARDSLRRGTLVTRDVTDHAASRHQPPPPPSPFPPTPPLSSPTSQNQDKDIEGKERARIGLGQGGLDSTEPPPGFPRSEEEAKATAGAAGITSEVAGRAWLLAASRGWRDARNIPIRSWRHYAAYCQARDRDRVAEASMRRPMPQMPPKPRAVHRGIQEYIPLPILNP